MPLYLMVAAAWITVVFPRPIHEPSLFLQDVCVYYIYIYIYRELTQFLPGHVVSHENWTGPGFAVDA